MVRIITASLAMATLAAAAPLLPRQSCVSGLYMIVARGSNEAPGEGKPGAVADAIAARVPGSTSVAVDYPATIISSSSEYPESVTDGINDTKTKIQNYVNACGSSSRIVLIGYSQGGNVMTDVLAGGVDKPDPITSEYAQYSKPINSVPVISETNEHQVTGTVVFGDPSFTDDQSFDRGNATKSGVFAREKGGASLALLNTYASTIRSYCDQHDTFCASGDDIDVHYAEVSDHLQEAADFIISLA